MRQPRLFRAQMLVNRNKNVKFANNNNDSYLIITRYTRNYGFFKYRTYPCQYIRH